jgi:prephenate dehydrogenase
LGSGLRAGIVGAGGRMGGWLTCHLGGIDYEVEPVDTRHEPGKLDALDLVVVSVSISATPAVIREVAPRMRRGAVLAEIASLKSGSQAAMLEASRLSVSPLCVHLMFCTSAASLRRRVVAVVQVAEPANEMEEARLLFSGADLVEMDAEYHDRCMTAVLSLPYAINLAFARVLGWEDLALALASRMAGPTFALQYLLAQSIAGESPALIRDLLNVNASLEPLLHTFTDSIEKLTRASSNEGVFTALHLEIMEALSRDPS